MLHVAHLKWTFQAPTFTPDLYTIHGDPNHQPWSPDLSLRVTNTELIQVALKLGWE